MSLEGRVLIVDDDRSLVRIVERVLQKEGLDVITAFDGPEGLQKARKERPDVIILDVIMPTMNGYKVCKLLQKDPDTSRIPVIFLTSEGRNEEITVWHQALVQKGIKAGEQAIQSGAMEFMCKPTSAKALLDKVKTLLWFSKL